MMQFIHADKYGIALELCKKFVSKKDIKPVVQYAYHKQNGDVIAMDNNKIIYFPKIHGYKEDLLIHPKSMTAAKGEYVELSRFVDNNGIILGDHKLSVTLSGEEISVWLQMFKSLNQLLTKNKIFNKHCTFKFMQDIFTLEIDNKDLKIELPYTFYERTIEQISVNAELFKDILEAHEKMKASETKIYFRAAMQPIILESESVQTLLLPLRVY